MTPRAGLFVTCIADTLRPSVGFAAVRLLECAGCEVVVPRQTCCGQPAYNSGDFNCARAIADSAIAAFEDCDYVVAPSGSCAAMLKLHVPALFSDAAPDQRARAHAFAAKVHELTSFLADTRGLTAVPGTFRGTLTYHDSCSGLRELGIKSAPRRLLAAMPGVDLREMSEAEACCGFGGVFAVKYPGISNAIVTRKTTHAAEADAGLLVGGDLGCLMNIAGRLSRLGINVPCRHVAEVLAGEMNDPPIGAPS